MKTAAQVLALNGYTKGMRAQTGAPSLAAEAAGVSRVTIYAWLNLPEFLDEIQRCRSVVHTKAWGVVLEHIQAKGLEASFEAIDRVSWDQSPKVLMQREKLEHARELKELEIRAAREKADTEHERRKELIALEHKNALDLIEARAKAGLPQEGEGAHYTLVVGEYGDPGFEEIPAPEERH